MPKYAILTYKDTPEPIQNIELDIKGDVTWRKAIAAARKHLNIYGRIKLVSHVYDSKEYKLINTSFSFTIRLCE